MGRVAVVAVAGVESDEEGGDVDLTFKESRDPEQGGQ